MSEASEVAKLGDFLTMGYELLIAISLFLSGCCREGVIFDSFLTSSEVVIEKSLHSGVHLGSELTAVTASINGEEGSVLVRLDDTVAIGINHF